MFKERILKLQNQIASKKAEAVAFVKLAESESRDLTGDEQAAIDLITETEIPDLNNQLARDEKLLAFSEVEDHSSDDSGATTGEVVDTVIVPAQARRHAKLQAFKGDNAEENAYSAGRFLMATIGDDQVSQEWCRNHGIETQHRGAMVTTDNQLGGYTVPTEMEVSIIALREMHGVFRRNAHTESLSSDVKTISRPTGGIVAYFSSEGASVTESESNWKSIELVARKLKAMTRMSDELNEDSIISIADQVARDVAFAFAKKEDQCGFIGDGTSTYGGIQGLLNKLLASSKYTAATGNTAFSTLDLADFEGMSGQLPEYAEADAKWYISKKGYYASMVRLLDASGGNTSMNIAGAPERMFLGYPVEIVQVMNTTLTAQTSTDGLLYLGDLAMSATLANRTGVSIESDSSVHFTTDEIAIKGRERFGINIHEFGAATGDSGPIIGLSTPSS